MQVVYSGGTNTPTPSPRLQRKTGYGRPVMPGYMTHVHPQILVQRSREKLTEGDITLRDSIPAMSKGVAVLCLVFNVIIPGSGTLLSGLSVLCCSHVRPKQDSRRHCIWVNSGVALLQFLLTFLFLLGWIWSITWGLAFLAVSRQFYYRGQDRLSGKNGPEEKKNHQHMSPCDGYSGISQSLSHHRHSPSPSSLAGSSCSINRISSSSADTKGTHQHQHNHNHHHHHQHPHRYTNHEKSSPNNNGHDGNRHQHLSMHTSKQESQPQGHYSPQHHHQQNFHHHHYPHHCHPQQHRQHQEENQHRQHRHNHHHYQQRQPKPAERVRLHQDDSDDVAVMPTGESSPDIAAVSFIGDTRESHLQPGSTSGIITASTATMAPTGGTTTAGYILDAESEAAGNQLAAAISTAPTNMNPQAGCSPVPVPVTTISVAPCPSHDKASRLHFRDEIALQPIIALQQVRTNDNDEGDDVDPATRALQLQASEEKIMRARTRHEKMLQRKMSDNDLSPFELTNQQLAAIIIHDLPVQAPLSETSIPEQPVVEGLPKF